MKKLIAIIITIGTILNLSSCGRPLGFDHIDQRVTTWINGYAVCTLLYEDWEIIYSTYIPVNLETDNIDSIAKVERKKMEKIMKNTKNIKITNY